MKHVSIFIIFLAFFGHKASFAVEVNSSTVEHKQMGQEEICPVHKGFARFEDLIEDEEVELNSESSEEATIGA